MNEEAYCNGSGSDLGSGTLDEKCRCMGYDSIPPLGPIPKIELSERLCTKYRNV